MGRQQQSYYHSITSTDLSRNQDKMDQERYLIQQGRQFKVCFGGKFVYGDCCDSL